MNDQAQISRRVLCRRLVLLTVSQKRKTYCGSLKSYAAGDSLAELNESRTRNRQIRQTLTISDACIIHYRRASSVYTSDPVNPRKFCALLTPSCLFYRTTRRRREQSGLRTAHPIAGLPPPRNSQERRLRRRHSDCFRPFRAIFPTIRLAEG